MKSIKNKTYEKFSKITNKTHYRKGLKDLDKARDQKLNPESAIFLYKEAIHNLIIAHEHHPISNEIKEALDQACSELFSCELSLLENSPENIIENKFFMKDLHASKNNLIFDERYEPANTRELVRILQQKNVSDEQKEKLRILAFEIINRFDPDDLDQILKRLKEKFENNHTQDKQIETIRTLGLLFDAMADCKVKDLSNEKLYNPLYKALENLSSDSNQELAYHARYACQALIWIPNDESPWTAFQKLPEAFEHLSKGLEGIEKIINGVIVLVKGILEGTSNIKQGLRALRYIDLFIQSRQFTALEKFVYKVPCFQENDFLWGLYYICQDKDENHWKNKHEHVVRQVSTELLKYVQSMQTLIEKVRPIQENDLEKNRGEISAQLDKLHELHNQFLSDIDEFNDDLGLYVKLQGTWNVPIIKLVNDKREMTFEEKTDDIEEVVNRFLKSKDKLVSEEEEILKIATAKLLNFKDKIVIINTVNDFFPPENKLTLKDERALEEAVNKFLDLNHKNTPKLLKILITSECLYDKILLTNAINYFNPNQITIEDVEDEDIIFLNKYLTLNILKKKTGGTGKSTFNRHLARRLCDEWEWKNVKIIISCRPEYLGKEYKKPFLPKNDEKMFQELTIVPFSQTEIEQYIRNYANKNRSLSLEEDTYKSLMSQEIKEWISNPILLKITLEVLPDLIRQDRNKDFQINRIVLYDQFLTWKYKEHLP
ncbi:18400_t:CDS:2 [Gigaspora margarita]|uniref:18400_t:CDS:1 n=1 Tax=Gigaspora margarita TaxID=4874 RepID=A0ABN7UL92_GIGMA|nr:18400_t:CDS:2 [Gigaspora margarita]